MTVDRVFIHHEGAGSPTDWPRGASGGYTAWIGPTRYSILRSPRWDYATIHYNHVAASICLSGNRQPAFLRSGAPVTDTEIRLIREACADLRRRGELTATPIVAAHRSVSSTACPGDRTMERWDEIVRACHADGGTTGGNTGGTDTRPTLREGDRGPVVVVLQTVMRDKAGQSIATDGIFGPATATAVRNVQRVFGLVADGIVGPRTWQAIDQLAKR